MDRMMDHYDKIASTVLIALALILSTILYGFGHEAGAAVIPTAAVFLVNQFRNTSKIAEVKVASEVHTDQLSALTNGKLTEAVKAAFVAAMREQGYTYTDPEPPTPPTLPSHP